MKNAGFGHDDILHIWNTVCSTSWHDQHNLFFKSGPQQFSFSYTQSVYFNIWFTQDSIPGAVGTSRGCMAGMTFADIVYALCFAPLSKSLRDILVESSICAYCYHGIPCVKTILNEASYADDGIVPCFCKASNSISNMVTTAKLANGVFLYMDFV